VKSLGNFPDLFRAEIGGQPEALRRAASSLEVQRDPLRHLAKLAREASTIVLTGMGSSYDALYPTVAGLATCGRPAVMVDAAELVHFRAGILDDRALVVAVSQSGESAELVRLVGDLERSRSRARLVSVTNDLANALAARADVALDTCAGREAGPSTMTFSASLVVLAAASAVLAGDSVEDAVSSVRAESGRAASAGERLLRDPGLPGELESRLGRAVVVLLGRGPARAAAEMGSLTLKEAAGVPAESLQTAQFRHGPLELAGPDLAAIVLATEAETRSLDHARHAAEELIEAGSAVLVVGPDTEGPSRATRLGVGSLHRLLAPAVSVVPAQLLAWRLALTRGRDPGIYTRASKVTTRE
jgi:glucosamine--fructose-6-phosphate aminotransferase (isomerizing)